MTLSRWHKKIYNSETGTETFIEYTPEEIAIAEAEELAMKNESLALQAAIEAEAEAKASARAAVLNRLGLTAEEAQLLLGGN